MANAGAGRVATPPYRSSPDKDRNCDTAPGVPVLSSHRNRGHHGPAIRHAFVSRRNSARSVMAEAVVNLQGKGRFRAYSAAVEPSAAVDPVAIEVLQHAGYATEGLHPNHWREFTGANAPVLDFVFTLSDTASRDVFPTWPGTPVSSHWRYPDPTKASGEDWQRRRRTIRLHNQTF